MAINSPTKDSSLSLWPPALTTDEPFVDLVKIGQHLPNGRKHLFEWEKQIKAETGNYVVLIDDDDDNDSDDIQLFASKKSKISKSKGTASEDDNKIDSLTTTEPFPYKWSIELDDIATGLPVDEKNQLNDATSSGNSTETISRRVKQRGSRKRKSSVFFSRGKEQEHWWKDARNIQDIIPVNPSGIVGVMGRTIHMDRFADNSDAGIYSMLRAWVEDDPNNSKSEQQSTRHADTSLSVTNRKSLLEYATLKENDGEANGGCDETNRRGDRAGTTTTGVSGSQGREAEGVEVATESTKEPTYFLKWLDTDPENRDCIPYYPTQQEMQEVVNRRKAKRVAKVARKQRIANIKRKLKMKGIVL